jgi:ABC-type cobalamin transport system permease subunit
MVFDTYKKTFWRMQIVIVCAALMVWAISHSRDLAALFFVVMQASSLLGASWATRLKSKVAREAELHLPRP